MRLIISTDILAVFIQNSDFAKFWILKKKYNPKHLVVFIDFE